MKKIEFKEVESKHLNAGPCGNYWAAIAAGAAVVGMIYLT